MFRRTTTVCHIAGVGPSTGTSLSVRDADPSDLGWAASLHLQQLPHGFFARLGARYLRAYHRSFVDSPHAVSLVAVRGGRRVGFIVGSADAAAHHRFVIRIHGWRLALAGVVALVVRPGVAVEFVRTRLRRYLRSLIRASTATAATDSPPAEAPSASVAVLTHVAVDPADERGGAGSVLVEAFIGRVRAVGPRRIELVTLAGARGAAGFYERLGWERSGASVRDGVAFIRFALDA